MQALGTDDVEKQFAALEGGGDIESELALLKSEQEIQPREKLPSAETGSFQDSQTDAELERLRSEIERT